jgi:hypothetical protein
MTGRASLFVPVAERMPARVIGLALAAMFASGLVLRKPWLPQTLDWAIVLPGLLWMLARHRDTLAGAFRESRLLGAVTGALAAYFIVLVVSTLIGDAEGGRGPLRHAWTSALCLTAVLAFAIAGRWDDAFPRIFGRAVGACAAIGAIVLLVVYAQGGGTGLTRLEGVASLNWVLNSNAVGGMYAACFGVALGHALRRDIAWWERVLSLLAGALVLLVVVLTQSRGALFGCGAATLVASLSLPRRWQLTGGLVVVTVAAVAAYLFADWIQLLLERGDGMRLGLWRHFVIIGLERPWLGRGLDFDTAFLLHEVPIMTPHNIVLASFVRGGVLGLAALVVAILVALAAAARAARRGWWMPIVVLAGTLTLSMVDHEAVPQTFGFYWYLFWMPLGLAAAGAIRPVDPVRTTPTEMPGASMMAGSPV